MRICYFADGRYIHALRWMKFFAERGHEMHLISFAPMSNENISEMTNIGVKCHGTIGNFHLKKFWLTLWDLKRLRKILRREKIDILHCHFLGANAWYAALSRFHPYIITIMGGGDVVGKDWKPGDDIREKKLTPLALRKADLITSWSQLMADVVRPYCRPETPIEVVHGGIHLDRFVPGPKPEYLLRRLELPVDASVVFSPRLMRPLSNVDKIAAAMAQITAQVPNAFLIIACPPHVIETEYLDRLKGILTENCAIKNTRFVYGIPHGEMADFFRLADVTVSIPDTDGTPMTVLESMACGTPTVIGDLSDYDRAYFENDLTTLMVDQKNSNAIADAVGSYLTNGDLSLSIAEEARRRVVATGGYEYQMGRMEQLYYGLVETPK